MKTSQIEKVVAELQAEKAIVDSCLNDCKGAEVNAADTLQRRSETLAACITRLSGNGTDAPKPTRTRKGRKAMSQAEGI